MAPLAFSQLQNAPNSFLVTLGELTALPRHPSWFKGDLLLRMRGGKGEEERERKGRREEEKGKGR